MFTKKSIIITTIPFLMIVCIFGIKRFLSHKQVEASHGQDVFLLSGGVENKRLKQPFVEFNGQGRKVAYLTFDDGPTKFLPEILNILAAHDVQATFFMIGDNLKKESRQDDVRRAVNEGHYVSVHSMGHDFHRLYREGYAVQEMLEAIEVLYDITETKPRLVRFPFGTYPGLNKELRDETAAAGLKAWDWTVDSLDWKYSEDGSKILANVKSQVKGNREVILFHETEGTVEILPEVIYYLKEQGYELKVYCEFTHFTLNKFKDERI